MKLIKIVTFIFFAGLITCNLSKNSTDENTKVVKLSNGLRLTLFVNILNNVSS